MPHVQLSLEDRLEALRQYCLQECEAITIIFHEDGTLTCYRGDNDSDDPDIDADTIGELVDALEADLEL